MGCEVSGSYGSNQLVMEESLSKKVTYALFKFTFVNQDTRDAFYGNISYELRKENNRGQILMKKSKFNFRCIPNYTFEVQSVSVPTGIPIWFTVSYRKDLGGELVQGTEDYYLNGSPTRKNPITLNIGDEFTHQFTYYSF